MAPPRHKGLRRGTIVQPQKQTDMPFFKAEKKAVNDLWYPRTVTVGRPLEMEDVCKRIAEMSTVSEPDSKAVLSALGKVNPLAAEETSDPKRDMPRGIIGAMALLFVTGAAALMLTTGGAGAAFTGTAAAPLVDTLNEVGSPLLATVVNYAGLAGLVASFFSTIYSASRQAFALSRAGYLPKFLSYTGERKTPFVALTVFGVIEFALAVGVANGSALLNMAVFAACVSYAMMNLSHILLRRNEPEMPRAFRAPCGVALTSISLVLSAVALVSTFFVDVVAAALTLAVLVVLMAYFFLYARYHLVGNAPDEEFAALAAAEAELA